METEKETNYNVINQFQENLPFWYPLKTAETIMFFRCVLGVKKGNIGLKWVDDSGREIISIRNNATLIYRINGQNATSASASNNVINGVTIFICQKFKICASDTLNQILQNFNSVTWEKIKLKTFIDNIRNLTKFSIFFFFV